MAFARRERQIPAMKLEGKVLLITGASEGIGAACAEAFGRRGARLALTARREEKLREAGRGAFTVAGDLLRAEDRGRIVAATLERYGRIDVLINNAGCGMYGAAWEAPLERARAMFELNFFAALEMAQLVAPAMRGRRCGTIVNVGSIGGRVTLPWMTLYSASKFALGSLTDGLRMELKRDGVHAMTVCPGYVKTEFQSHALEGGPPEAVRKGRRFAITAEECAEAIARGVERDARTVVTPRVGRALVALARLFPGVAERRMERMIEPAA